MARPEPGTLWRYVTIDKFLAMLVDRALFASRLEWYGEAYEELRDLIPRHLDCIGARCS